MQIHLNQLIQKLNSSIVIIESFRHLEALMWYNVATLMYNEQHTHWSKIKRLEDKKCPKAGSLILKKFPTKNTNPPLLTHHNHQMKTFRSFLCSAP